ncbi:MAG: glycosyltransferase family 39 protein, partial [bacterium]
MKTDRIPIEIGKWQILIPLIFLGLYLTYLYDIADEPFFKYLVVNPLVYDNDARLILQGIPSSQPFFLSPLFPGWLASVYSITNSSRLAVAVINGIVGMLSVYLIGALTRQLFGKIAGLVSSLIAIGYWCLYYFCGELMPTILCISAVLASTYCIIATTAKEMRIPLSILGLISIGFISHINPAVKSIRTSRPSYLGNPIANLTFLLVFIGGVTILLVIFLNPKLKNRANYAVGGLLAGLSMLLWSGTALYSLMLTVHIAIKRVEKSAVIGWLVGMLIPLAASTCHNYVITTDLIPLTTSFGVNLFIGNNPTSDGMNPFNFGTRNHIRIEADRRGLSGKARSDFFKQKAMEFIRNEKVKWVKLLGRKALISMSRAEVSNNADISERKQSWRMAPIAFVNFGVILPLALIGLASSFRKSEGGLLLFLGFICFMIIQIAVCACERFRIPGSTLLIP